MVGWFQYNIFLKISKLFVFLWGYAHVIYISTFGDENYGQIYLGQNLNNINDAKSFSVSWDVMSVKISCQNTSDETYLVRRVNILENGFGLSNFVRRKRNSTCNFNAFNF